MADNVGKKIMKPLAHAMLLAGAFAMLSGCDTLGLKKGKPKTPVVGNRVSILTNERGVEVDPAIADVAVTLPDAVENDEWSQPGGSPSKAMGHLALGAAPAQAWTATIKGSTPRARLASAPVVSGGKLFVIDTEANVLALD